MAVPDIASRASTTTSGPAPTATATAAIAFPRRAIDFYRRHNIIVGVTTDNGPASRPAIHAVTWRTLGIRHLRTRPIAASTS